MDLPRCPYCDSLDYDSGGGTFGPRLTQRSHTCTCCGAFVTDIGQMAGRVVAFIPKSQCEKTEHDSYIFPDAFSEYINGVLMPTWRDRATKLEAHKTLEWETWIRDVFKPQWPDLDYPQGKLSFYDLPEDARKAIEDVFGGSTRAHMAGDHLPLPDDVQGPVYPPQAPDSFVLFYWSKAGWFKVDPTYSATLDVPEDPILVNNREFFTDVWSALESATGYGIARPVEEIKNQYGGIEPWYTFPFGDAVFTIGWRKRVVSIQVETTEGLDTKAIRALAIDRDKVTYIAEGPMGIETADDLKALLEEEAKTEENVSQDLIDKLVAMHRENHPDGKATRVGGWQDDRPVAHKIEVHAWGKDKTVEYLSTLCREALRT